MINDGVTEVQSEHTPEAGDGGGLDEEVLEGVLLEAGRVCWFQLFVGGLDEDARTRSVLRPTLLRGNEKDSRLFC